MPISEVLIDAFTYVKLYIFSNKIGQIKQQQQFEWKMRKVGKLLTHIIPISIAIQKII